MGYRPDILYEADHDYRFFFSSEQNQLARVGTAHSQPGYRGGNLQGKEVGILLADNLFSVHAFQ